MKKTFFYFAMAACVSAGFVACGSDGDDYVAPKVEVQLPLPEYASEAVSFDNIAEVESSGAELESINFTEGGKAILEIDGDYYSYDYEVANGTYTIKENGRSIGTVRETTARGVSSQGTAIEINISVTIGGVTYSFNSADAAANKVTASEMIGNTNLNNVARSWTVKTMALALDGDVSMMKRYDSGDLSQLAKDANENGAGLTADEVAQLNKTFNGVEFTKYGKLFINYTEQDKTHIVSVDWSSSDFENFLVKAISENNKFISNGSSIEVAFNEAGGCLFTFKTTIRGNKTYNAQLSVVLQ